MNKRLLLIMVSLFFLSGGLAGCGLDDPTINSAKVTRESVMDEDVRLDTIDASDHFFPDDVIYAAVELTAPNDTDFRAVLHYNGAEEQTLEEITLKTNSGEVVFALHPTELWEVGPYELIIYLGEEAQQTLAFDVGLGEFIGG